MYEMRGVRSGICEVRGKVRDVVRKGVGEEEG